MIIFMGVAGAGKSVQGQLLAENLGYKWLSTGQYIRDNMPEEYLELMRQGKLIGDEEVISILKNFFAQIEDQNKTIIDGFPRTINQAKWLVNEHQNGNLKVACVVYLAASKEVVLNRLLTRARDDDSEEAIKERFNQYEKETSPIIDWFKDQGIMVYTIDAEPSVEQVQAEILSKVK